MSRPGRFIKNKSAIRFNFQTVGRAVRAFFAAWGKLIPPPARTARPTLSFFD